MESRVKRGCARRHPACLIDDDDDAERTRHEFRDEEEGEARLWWKMPTLGMVSLARRRRGKRCDRTPCALLIAHCRGLLRALLSRQHRAPIASY